MTEKPPRSLASADDVPALTAEEGVRPEHYQAAEARHALFRAMSRSASKRPSFQYSLGELIALTAFAGAVFSAAHYLPLPVFAGLAGTAALLAMALDHLIPPRLRWLRGAWIALAAGYVIAAAVALFSR
ncbi:MAG: hypothetical protein KY475_13105 [Planctomycetes bacterium]|nr:hypothetical protein [Planctomycetota bacterium]